MRGKGLIVKIEIFNVEHGQCSVITLPNGKKIMVDAGHRSASDPNYGWRPSSHFYGQQFEELIISNFDEDHASDFANVMKHCTIRYITVNTSVTPQVLQQMKNANGMGNGIKAVHNWWSLAWQNWNVGIGGIPDHGNASISHYWNNYGYLHTDENNLSVATFIEWNGFSILFTGDLEEEGWESLIARADFRQKLSGVTVLMASHHGRDNGCCDSVFNWNNQRLCNPQCTIISDGGIQHATQDTRNWYKSRTRGCLTTDNKQRWVLSTCSDDHIKINVEDNGRWSIETNYKPPSATISSLLGLSSLASVR